MPLRFSVPKEYVEELEGLGRKMPVTFGCYTIYALALTGIPPLCGFFSKWFIATAAIEVNTVFSLIGVVGLLISAFLTSMYMLSPAIKAFFPRNEIKEKSKTIKEADIKMLAPMVLCALCRIIFGLFSSFPINLIQEVLGI